MTVKIFTPQRHKAHKEKTIKLSLCPLCLCGEVWLRPKLRYVRGMKKALENYAFIDSQNLNLGIRDQGWESDFYRFRIYLRRKYGVAKAYMFLGYLQENERMYDSLKRNGYELVFKPVVRMKNKVYCLRKSIALFGRA